MGSFDGDVTVRHVRYANAREAAGPCSTPPRADGTPVALVGPLVHLEQGERARIVGTWVERQPLRAAGQGLAGTAARRPTIRDALVGVSAPGQARRRQARRRPGRRASGSSEVFDAIDARPRRRVRAGRAARHAGRGGGRVLAAAAGHPPAAPAAGAARARLPRPPDPRPLRRRRARGVSRNPYELTSVFGVGFLIADRIALGRPAPTEQQRRRSASARRSCTCWPRPSADGSTCMPRRRAAGGRRGAARRRGRRVDADRRSSSRPATSSARASGSTARDRRARGRARRADRRARARPTRANGCRRTRTQAIGARARELTAEQLRGAAQRRSAAGCR